jgi:hypothetical protein
VVLQVAAESADETFLVIEDEDSVGWHPWRR